MKNMTFFIKIFFLLYITYGVAVAHAQKTRTIIHNGNTFVRSVGVLDTVYSVNDTEEVMRICVSKEFIISMNGEKVHDLEEMTNQPHIRQRKQTFEEYMLSKLEGCFRTLPNGKYTFQLREIVIDKFGRIVYHEYWYMDRKDSRSKVAYISGRFDRELDSLTGDIIKNAPLFVPAKLNGQKVIAYYPAKFDKYIIDVTEGVATFAMMGQ